MELGERKIKILNAIIQTYLDTGEPVGSRTISKFSDLDLSSATIRNEMSDLEDMGYIFQPHTSAGRIPTDKGYRFYVDNMLKEKTAEAEEQNKVMVQKVDRLEEMLKQVVKLLATSTNYASMISAPQPQVSKLKFIQLSLVSGYEILAVMMLEGGILKHRVIDLDSPLEEQDVVRLNLLLNTYLQGKALGDINLALIQEIKKHDQSHKDTISHLIDIIAECLQEAETEIYTSGATNLLKYPELGDREKSTQLLSAFEDKKSLEEFISDKDDANSDNHGIQVYIGSESPVQSMQNCSVVTATYEIEDGVYGTIGIIGPKRMDYKKVVGNLETVMKQLDAIYKKNDDDDD